MSEAMIARNGAGKSQWLLTDHLTPLLTKAHTGGRLGVVIHRALPGSGPPPHLHRDEDEGFYVIEGELTFLSGDRLVAAGPGTFVWGPRDMVHCFKGSSSTPTKSLLIYTPATFGDFADALAVPANDADQPPAVTPDMIDKLMSIAPQYGIEMKFDHPMPTVVSTAAGASRQLWVMGEHVSFLATSEQTGGQFTIVELLTAPGGGPPSHVHTAQDEIIYVLDGQHEFVLGARTEIAGPGDLVYVPHGTRHRYSNTGGQPGKLLSIHTPGGFEAFFEECGVDATQHPTAPAMPAPPPEAMAALLARHGMTM